jgi:hypothetical protein
MPFIGLRRGLNRWGVMIIVLGRLRVVLGNDWRDLPLLDAAAPEVPGQADEEHPRKGGANSHARGGASRQARGRRRIGPSVPGCGRRRGRR